MIKLFIYLLLLFSIIAADIQQPSVHDFYILMPQIDETYNIVTTFIYPAQAGNKFIATVAPDYYFLKQKEERSQLQPAQAKSSQKQSAALKRVYLQMEEKKYIEFPQKQMILPAITEYLATKQIYPNAKISEQILPFSIAIPKKSQDFNVAEKSQQLNFENKSIVWKINDQLPIPNFVVQNGIEVPLVKALQKIDQKQKQQIKEPSQVRIFIKKLEQPSPFIASPVISTPLIIQPQIRSQVPVKQISVQSPNIVKKDQSSSNLSTNKQSDQIKQKNTHWSMTIVAIIIVFILAIFLLYRFKGSRKPQIWRSIQQKLQVYKQSVPINEDQDQTLNSSIQRDGYYEQKQQQNDDEY